MFSTWSRNKISQPNAKSFWYAVTMSEHKVKLGGLLHKFSRTISDEQVFFPSLIHKILYEPKPGKRLKINIHLPIVSAKHIQGIIPCNKGMLATSGIIKDGAKNASFQMATYFYSIYNDLQSIVFI